MRPEVKMRVAPVGTKGQLDITALAARGKDLFHIRLLFLMIGRFELIELPQTFLIHALLTHDLVVQRIVDQPPRHLLVFGHISSLFP